MSDVASELAAVTAELVAIPSVSREEARIADHVESFLVRNSDMEVARINNNVIATAPGYDPATGVILAGHLDTVPPFGPPGASLVDGVVAGLGAVDMKGGLAVMLRLAVNPPPIPFRLVFYASEEISRSFSGLLEVDGEAPELLEGSVAIVMEPTGGLVEAGCQGTAKFDVHIGGVRAHTARPHKGINAIHRSHQLLAWLDARPQGEVLIEGCLFRPSLSAVLIRGGIAGNVVPDSLDLQLNCRFAPTGDDQGALSEIENAIGERLDPERGDTVSLLDWAPSAPPNLGNPVIAELMKVSGGVRAKLGWTDVAFFWERGVPACNFGPGDPELAHTSSEVVSGEELAATWDALGAVLSAQAG